MARIRDHSNHLCTCAYRSICRPLDESRWRTIDERYRSVRAAADRMPSALYPAIWHGQRSCLVVR
jgi:hypothetical protein